jgi:hypothetical protein
VLFTEEDRSDLIGGLPGFGRSLGISPAVVPGTIGPATNSSASEAEVFSSWSAAGTKIASGS